METELERESLSKALNKLGLNKMPDKLADDEKRIWAVGIAKITKNDFSRNYAIVVNDGYGNPSIKEDFGKSAQMVKIEDICPMAYLDETTMPNLRTQSDIVKYLRQRDYDADEISSLLTSKGKTEKKTAKDRAVVQSYIIECAIKDLFDTRF